MFKSLEYTEFESLAEKSQFVPVYKELLADTFTPISVFESLVPEKADAILLESGLRFHESGAYSFIGYEPYASLSTKNGITTITHKQTSVTATQNPFEVMREFHKKFRCAENIVSAHAGNMMGFLAYDAIRYCEQIPNSHEDDPDLPDILFHFYRINFVFDHDSKKLLIVIVVDGQDDPKKSFESAQAEIEQLIVQLKKSSPSVALTGDYHAAVVSTFETDCDDAAFEEKVKKAQEYIKAGDAFQIVLSRKFYKPLQADPLAIYRVLRQSNPTPYMFYITNSNFTCFGASPEKLVSVENRKVTIAPIAGTIPTTDESDAVLTQKLRDDKKQYAEHTMLVDLSRNDIGAVCEPGSIVVSDFMFGLRLTHVMHLVSYVIGRLAKQYDAFDLIRFCFPAGTLSGAPKIRAMEIIDALENSKRHLYGGCICKIDSAGNMDSCIIIRSGVIKQGMITMRAGAGIVFDSKPAEEAEETLHKAKGVLKAVSIAERGGL